MESLIDRMALTLLIGKESLFEPGGHMNKILVPLLTTGILLLSACSHKSNKDEKKQEEESKSAKVTPVTQEGITSMTKSWPEASRAAVNAMISKYGMPASAADEMIVWENTAPFKRSIVYKEQVNHMFPVQHSDVLQQVVNYRVPLDKVAALAKFDGSLMVDRTKGELSSRNEKEEMNILALNLADEIIKGNMTVEQARREYSKSAEAFASGTSNKRITSLNIKNQDNTQDPDTMMQSQSEQQQPTFKRTIQTEEVQEVIEE